MKNSELSEKVRRGQSLVGNEVPKNIGKRMKSRREKRLANRAGNLGMGIRRVPIPDVYLLHSSPGLYSAAILRQYSGLDAVEHFLDDEERSYVKTAIAARYEQNMVRAGEPVA